jgi:drug/metabolite transporter (DMT)-like permease
MNNLLKYLGIVVLLIGVAILAVSSFTSGVTNAILLLGAGVVIAGYLLHIYLNKKID